MDSNKFIEIKKPIEEVREIESTEQKQLDENQKNKPTITESVKEAVIPTIHASADDDDKKAAEIGGGGIIGLASIFPPTAPFAQFMAAGETAAGTAVEKIGEAKGDEDMKEGGEITKKMGEVGSLPSVAKGGINALKKASG